MRKFFSKNRQSEIVNNSGDIAEWSDPGPEKISTSKMLELDLSPGDPFLEYLLTAPGVVELDRLNLDSPSLRALKEAGVKLSVPLVSQGELIGVLNLGPRMSEQEYSSDDYHLISNLARQASPALRVAQLARQQQAEARERERLETELRVARMIQETLLPKELPAIAGWRVNAQWQPARAVSGDFYDFVLFPDGKLGVFTGDVTDKGVPAALVMATTRSVLRAATERFNSPGKILEQANNQLFPDIPPNMFVTCLCAIIDPASGTMVYANAGHNPPYRYTGEGIIELKATGMPLGLMPDMAYEEKETKIDYGDRILMFSDGLLEAHNPQREMFGFERVRTLAEGCPDGETMIAFLLKKLAEFTGEGWEQEDDVTLLTLERLGADLEEPLPAEPTLVEKGETWKLLAEFSLPSEPGNELETMRRVAASVARLNMPIAQLERLKTAVAETAMNAIEHGNHYQEDLPINVEVFSSNAKLSVRISDFGVDQVAHEYEEPNIDAKLEGKQSPRGWGLFLVKNMVDEVNVTTDKALHTVELILNLEGDQTA